MVRVLTAVAAARPWPQEEEEEEDEDDIANDWPTGAPVWKEDPAPAPTADPAVLVDYKAKKLVNLRCDCLTDPPPHAVRSHAVVCVLMVYLLCPTTHRHDRVYRARIALVREPLPAVRCCVLSGGTFLANIMCSFGDNFPPPPPFPRHTQSH